MCIEIVFILAFCENEKNDNDRGVGGGRREQKSREERDTCTNERTRIITLSSNSNWKILKMKIRRSQLETTIIKLLHSKTERNFFFRDKKNDDAQVGKGFEKYFHFGMPVKFYGSILSACTQCICFVYMYELNVKQR